MTIDFLNSAMVKGIKGDHICRVSVNKAEAIDADMDFLTANLEVKLPIKNADGLKDALLYIVIPEQTELTSAASETIGRSIIEFPEYINQHENIEKPFKELLQQILISQGGE
jgi:hypothetical protein